MYFSLQSNEVLADFFCYLVSQLKSFLLKEDKNRETQCVSPVTKWLLGLVWITVQLATRAHPRWCACMAPIVPSQSIGPMAKTWENAPVENTLASHMIQVFRKYMGLRGEYAFKINWSSCQLLNYTDLCKGCNKLRTVKQLKMKWKDIRASLAVFKKAFILFGCEVREQEKQRLNSVFKSKNLPVSKTERSSKQDLLCQELAAWLGKLGPWHMK